MGSLCAADRAGEGDDGRPVQRSGRTSGGTGREGRGLALRWAAKGHDVVIGSRDAARAKEKAQEIAAELPDGGARITGGSNEEAARLFRLNGREEAQHGARCQQAAELLAEQGGG